MADWLHPRRYRFRSPVHKSSSGLHHNKTRPPLQGTLRRRKLKTMASLVGLAALLIVSISATQACSCVWPAPHPQAYFCGADFGEVSQYAAIVCFFAHWLESLIVHLEVLELNLPALFFFRQWFVLQLSTLRLPKEITASALKFTTWRSRKSSKAKTQSRTHQAQSLPDEPTSRRCFTRRLPPVAVHFISPPVSSFSWREPLMRRNSSTPDSVIGSKSGAGWPAVSGLVSDVTTPPTATELSRRSATVHNARKNCRAARTSGACVLSHFVITVALCNTCRTL